MTATKPTPLELAVLRDVAARATTIERVAEAIYRNDGGMTDEAHVFVLGHPRRAWKTDAPWDSQSDVELCEHERDEYRAMAEAAIAALLGELTEHSKSICLTTGNPCSTDTWMLRGGCNCEHCVAYRAALKEGGLNNGDR